MLTPQYILPLADELVVEEFSCAGGMGTGIQQALGRHVDVAVNHDQDACSLYRANHPQTKVYCADVFGKEVDPILVTGDRPVGLFHMSPDCTDHSQAKGGQPRSKRLRALVWIGLKWAGKKRPRIITMENVKQILQWGPLIAKRDKATGRVVKLDGSVAAPGERVPVQEQYLIPDPKQLGRYWRRYVSLLRQMGYDVDYWLLCAADHGAGTSRVRLFKVARCDGAPIVKPSPTHYAKPARGQRRWRAAYESIDWSIPSQSIFDRKKPLVEASCRRVAYGLKKFVLDNADPFIVPVTHSGGIRCHDIREPLRTITTAQRGEFMLATPTLVQVSFGERKGQAPRALDIEQPLGTIVAGGIKHALVTAFVEQANGGKNTDPAKGVDAPLSTILTKGANQRLVTAHLATLRQHCVGVDMRDPVPTITSGGEHHALVEYHLSPEAEAGALRCAAFLIRYYGEGGQLGDLRAPMSTITTKDRLALVTVWLRGTPYVVVDICMRMLVPRELAHASSFPDWYVFDRGHDGRVFSKTKQVFFIGNAVPPLLGEAVIRAQWNSRSPMTQLTLAVFGLASAWMAMVSLSPRARRWAPVVGLCGQPAWAIFALSLEPAVGWPLYLTVPAFTLVYIKGAWVQWKRGGNA
jgi:DNA (cytosine-5)-methyltransferase 1